MNALPDARETLLIRAATGSGPSAVAAWEKWRDSGDFDALDGESVRIVPLLYRNLLRLGVQAPELVRYGSVYRHSWAANRLAFLASARALALLNDANIPTLLLKGAALTVLYYRDVGVRSMGDVDVLVPVARTADAIAALEAAGWFRDEELKAELTAAHLSTHHSAGFADPKGREIDLHWYASADARWPGADDELWRYSLPVEFEGVATLALSPTDLLYNVLAHGYASFAGHIRWAADAATILANPGNAIDWARFVRIAETRRMVLPLIASLSWLVRELGVVVPDSALSALAKAKVNRVDRLEFEHRNAADPYTIGKVALRHWCWHRRASPVQTPLALTLGFPDYLGRYYGVESAWELPRLLLERGIARIRRRG